MSAWKSYDPQKPKRAPNISEEEWQVYKDAILRMYRESYTHAGMLKKLHTERNFNPSKSQLAARLKTWNFMVHSRPLLPQHPSSVTTSDYESGAGLESDHTGHDGNLDGQEPTRSVDANDQRARPADWLDPKHGSTSRQSGIDDFQVTNAKKPGRSRTAHDQIPEFTEIQPSEVTRIRGLALIMGISAFWRDRIIATTSLTDYLEELWMVADLLELGGNRIAADMYYGFLVRCFPEECEISELPLTYGLIYETYRIRSMFRRQDQASLPSDIPMPASLAQTHQQHLPPHSRIGRGTRSILAAFVVLSGGTTAENRKHLQNELSHISMCPTFLDFICKMRAWVFAVLCINYDDIWTVRLANRGPQSFVCRLLAYLSSAWQRYSSSLKHKIYCHDDCDCGALLGMEFWQLRIISCLIFSVIEASEELFHLNMNSLMLNRLCLDACKPSESQWDCLVESLQMKLTRTRFGGEPGIFDARSELGDLVTKHSFFLFPRARLTRNDIEQIEKLTAEPRTWESYARFLSYAASQEHAFIFPGRIETVHAHFLESLGTARPTSRLPHCPSVWSEVPWLSDGHTLMLLHAFSLASLAVDCDRAGHREAARTLYRSVCRIMRHANAVVSGADANKHGAIELLRKYLTRVRDLSNPWEARQLVAEFAEVDFENDPQDREGSWDISASLQNLATDVGTSGETHEKDDIQDIEHTTLSRQRRSRLRSSTSESDHDKELHTPQRRIADLSSWPIPKPEMSSMAEIETIAEILDAVTVEDVSNSLAVGTGDGNSPLPPFPRYGEFLPAMTDSDRASMISTGRSNQLTSLNLTMRIRNSKEGSKKSTHSSRMSIETRSSWSLHHAAGYPMSIDSKSEAPSRMSFVS